MDYAHCFYCTECGAGTKTSSGVPNECYNCGAGLCFIRITPEEYNKLETNEGDVS